MKLKKIIFLCILAFTLTFSMIFVPLVPVITNGQLNAKDVKDLPDPPQSLEETFMFIIDRLNEMRSSRGFTVTETGGEDSFSLTASNGDETVSVDESYEIKEIINQHQTNQSSTTQPAGPTKNQTSVDIIMGFTYQLITYKWEVSWKLEIFGFEIAYAYFGIEIDIGAGIRFPAEVIVDYYNEVVEDTPTTMNVTLNTIDLPNFDETYFHFIARLYAGVSAFGFDGEWSIGPNIREDRSYETPLGPANFVDLGELSIPILEIIGNLNIPYVSAIADVISNLIVEILFKIRFAVGSNLLTMQASLFGNDTHFDNVSGPTSQTLSFVDANTTQVLTVLTKEPGPVRLELNDFVYHLNQLQIKLLLGLQWKTVFAWLFDDMEWEIYRFTVPIGNWLQFGTRNRVTVQMNSTAIPPIYDVQFVFIEGMKSIEPGDEGVEYFVALENTGQNIKHDTYDIEVTGIDPSWVVHPPTVTAKQGASGYFRMIIEPPRAYSTTATIQQFNVTATSRNDPTKFDTITGSVNILPYYEAKVERTSLFATGVLDVDPDVMTNVTFNITNMGNALETYNLSMTAEGLNTSIFELPANVTLNPGESVIVNPNVTVPKSPDFPALRYSVELTAQSVSDTFSTSDTVQMNILPYKNLSIIITPRSIPSVIVAGSQLVYDVDIVNNGNFNDTIELVLTGLPPSSYHIADNTEILFPGQVLNTTLTITIPLTANILGETYDLVFSGQFASNQTISIGQTISIETAPNYLPFISMTVLVAVVIGVGVFGTTIIIAVGTPYAREKAEQRKMRKFREKEAKQIRVRIDNCPHCFRRLSEGELKTLNTNLNTLCVKCGKIIRPEFLEISVPKEQQYIHEIVSKKVKKVEEKQKRQESMKQYKEKLDRVTYDLIKYCPHCRKGLANVEINSLKKGTMTMCSKCGKVVKPEHFK